MATVEPGNQVTTPDLDGRIDDVLDEWDGWSADAARWTPGNGWDDFRVRPVFASGGVISVAPVGTPLTGRHADGWRQIGHLTVDGLTADHPRDPTRITLPVQVDLSGAAAAFRNIQLSLGPMGRAFTVAAADLNRRLVRALGTFTLPDPHHRREDPAASAWHTEYHRRRKARARRRRR